MNTNNKKRTLQMILLGFSIAYLVAYIVLIIVKLSIPKSGFALDFFDKYIWIVKQTIEENGETVTVAPSTLQVIINSLITIVLILSISKVLRT